MSTFFGCYAQIPRFNRFNSHVDLQIPWSCLDFEVQRPRRSLLNLFHAGFILDPCLASSIRMVPIIFFKHVLSTFFVKIKAISLSSARERERERKRKRKRERKRERENKRDVLRRKQMDCEYGRGVELARRTGMEVWKASNQLSLLCCKDGNIHDLAMFG